MKTSRHFSLLELLTVMSIIAILASMMVPALQRANDAALATQCISNLRQINQAFTMYAADNRGRLMPYITGGTLYQHPGLNWTWMLRKYYEDTEILDCPTSPASAPEPTAQACHLYDGNYGWNYDGTQGNNGPIYSHITAPSRSYLVFDSGDPCIIYGANTWDNLMEELDLDWDSKLEGPNRHRNLLNTGFVDGHVAALQLHEFISAPCKSYEFPWNMEWQGGVLEPAIIPYPVR